MVLKKEHINIYFERNKDLKPILHRKIKILIIIFHNMKIVFSLMLFFLSCTFALHAQEKIDLAKALIVYEDKEGMLDINATCISNTAHEMELSYNMEIEKKGVSGSASNKQSCKFKIAGGEEKILAKNSFNINKGDTYSITLQLFKEGKLIAEDKIKYPTQTKEDQQ